MYLRKSQHKSGVNHNINLVQHAASNQYIIHIDEATQSISAMIESLYINSTETVRNIVFVGL